MRTITLAFSGDIIPHGRVVGQARANAGVAGGYDFAPSFARVQPIVAAADLALCHLETPLSIDNTGISGYPQFNAPRELAEGIAAAGYDGCSAASNHSYDRREDGVVQTADILEANGLGFAGLVRSPDEIGRVQTYDVDGISVAHLSFTYGLNGFSLPADRGYLVDLIDPDLIETRASAARAGGADIVVVSMHWGNEYDTNPTTYQTDLAARLAPHPDIDLLIGHHAHVVQPVDRIGGTFVVYGLGNFLSNQSAECCTRATQDGALVQITFRERTEGRFVTSGGCVVPTWVDRSDYVILEESAERPLPPESAVRTRETIGRLGAYDAGFRPTC